MEGVGLVDQVDVVVVGGVERGGWCRRARAHAATAASQLIENLLATQSALPARPASPAWPACSPSNILLAASQRSF